LRQGDQPKPAGRLQTEAVAEPCMGSSHMKVIESSRKNHAVEEKALEKH